MSRSMMTPIISIGLIAMWVLGGGVPRGHADDWTGTISSARLKDIPRNAAFDVLIYDDTEDNLRFRTKFLAALSDAGYATGNEARLVFSFEPEFTRSDRVIPGPGDRKVDLSGASRYAQRGPRVGLTNEEWMLGNKKRWVVRRNYSWQRPQADRLHVIVRLRDTRSGTVLWYADLYCDLLAIDRERIVRSIIGPIIARMGQTRTAENFTIR